MEIEKVHTILYKDSGHFVYAINNLLHSFMRESKNQKSVRLTSIFQTN